MSVLGELVPRLCELIKSGVGLGTKVCLILIVHLEMERGVNVNRVLMAVSFKVTAWAHSYWSHFTSQSQSTLHYL